MTALIGTSWKMNLTPSEAVDWFARAVPALTAVDDRELFVLPPFPAIHVAQAALRATSIGWGAQDVHPDDSGAHTGDVSAPMLADLGCRFVEIGHSERRRDHAEGDGLIAAKVRAALRWNLTPILCVGERRRTSFERARAVITRQLRGALRPRALLELQPDGHPQPVGRLHPARKQRGVRQTSPSAYQLGPTRGPLVRDGPQRRSRALQP